jgi:hypothetical protein
MPARVLGEVDPERLREELREARATASAACRFVGERRGFSIPPPGGDPTAGMALNSRLNRRLTEWRESGGYRGSFGG